MKNLKMMVKLMGGFFMVALITLVVGYVGWGSINSLDGNLIEISNVRLPSIKGLLMMSEQMEAMTKVQRTLLDPKLEMAGRKQQYQEFAEARKRFKIAWDMYEPLPQTEEEARDWKEFTAAWQAVEKGNNAFFKLCDELDKTDILNPMALRAKLETFRGDHYQLMERTLNTIFTGVVFAGGDDAASCAFGKWISAFKTGNADIMASLKDTSEHHLQFH